MATTRSSYRSNYITIGQPNADTNYRTVRLPKTCVYRSLILTNGIYETTDWYNNHSSLNGAQAPAHSDGILRIVVSARDPGLPNWLDTAGYPTGIIQGRWTDCSSQPVPTVRKVAISDVAKSLPASTPRISPQERDKVTLDRRARAMGNNSR
ncbi:MAG TPA: hypothetical protein VF463_19795 [Sphingobium sp.]